MKPLCEICKKSFGLQRHHKYSQVKFARKLYGDLLDDPKNIQTVCWNCHAGHNSPGLIRWSEKEFCAALKIYPRSKIGI